MKISVITDKMPHLSLYEQYQSIIKHYIKRPECQIHIHTHTCLTALCPGLPGVSRYQKGKQIWILLKQESEWQ